MLFTNQEKVLTWFFQSNKTQSRTLSPAKERQLLILKFIRWADSFSEGKLTKK
jgi:hypothetical protein